nr:vegetative cell wall protein gp1-like [Aegilops tauschii subsp. strangulata]
MPSPTHAAPRGASTPPPPKPAGPVRRPPRPASPHPRPPAPPAAPPRPGSPPSASSPAAIAGAPRRSAVFCPRARIEYSCLKVSEQGTATSTCNFFREELEGREATAARAPPDAGEKQKHELDWLQKQKHERRRFLFTEGATVTSFSGGKRRTTTAGPTSKETSGEKGSGGPADHPEDLERLGEA